jgi:hypothetical protein
MREQKGKRIHVKKRARGGRFRKMNDPEEEKSTQRLQIEWNRSGPRARAQKPLSEPLECSPGTSCPDTDLSECDSFSGGGERGCVFIIGDPPLGVRVPDMADPGDAGGSPADNEIFSLRARRRRTSDSI